MTKSAFQIQNSAAAAIAECRLIATMTEEPGRIIRRFLTPPVVAVHAHLRSRMEALEMKVTVDAAGNLLGRWIPTGAGSNRVILGSHIDTVPDAGAFDGVLGVVLALELVEAARATSLPLAIEVIAFSEEEGVRFGVPFLGSRAVAGRFDPTLLNLRDSEGISVAEMIRNFGLDPNGIDAAQIGDDVMGFFEIHIEQGPVLEAENMSLGVVTGIIGQTRCEVRFAGKSNHAGTTPMNLRQDALAAAAEWISIVEQTALLHQSSLAVDLDSPTQPTLVATVGKLTILPNAGNVIAGSVCASLDVRHERDTVRQSVTAELLEKAEAIAKRRHLACEITRKMDQSAVSMDERWTAMLSESVEAAGFPLRRLPSGAGHDAMVMATRVPAAMLFLRSPGGISHHPDEFVFEQDVAAALATGFLFLDRVSKLR